MNKYCSDIASFLGMALLVFGLNHSGAEAGAIKGTITVDGGKKLNNIIIYMVSVDGKNYGGGNAITVSQANSSFNPPFNVIVSGSEVHFTNNEVKNIDHNVYSLSEQGKFDIGLNGRGTDKSVPFNNVGTIKFYCSIHKSMEGILGVVPTPYFAKLAKPGDFKIDNVPPGNWTLKAMISHRRYTAVPIEKIVADDGSTSVAMIIGKKSRKKKKQTKMDSVEFAMLPANIYIPADGPDEITVHLSIDKNVIQVVE